MVYKAPETPETPGAEALPALPADFGVMRTRGFTAWAQLTRAAARKVGKDSFMLDVIIKKVVNSKQTDEL
jgi:hypothetical protein